MGSTLALVLALVITTAIGSLRRRGGTELRIYFLMLTLTYGDRQYFFGQVTQFGGFSPIAGVDQHTPGSVGDIVGHPDKLYYIAFGVALLFTERSAISSGRRSGSRCRVYGTTRSA